MNLNRLWKSFRVRVVSITTLSILMVVVVWIMGVNRIVLNTLTEQIDTELRLLAHNSNRLLRNWLTDNSFVSDTTTQEMSRDVLVILDTAGRVLYLSNRIKEADFIPGYDEMMELQGSYFPSSLSYRLNRVLRTGEPDDGLMEEIEQQITEAQISEANRLRRSIEIWSEGSLKLMINGEEWRCLPTAALGNRLLYGKSMSDVYAKSRSIFIKLIFLVGVLTVMVIAVTWFIAQRNLRPVHKMSMLAETLDADSLDQRLDVGKAPSEFWGLLSVFNKMLERLEKSFHQSRQFTANASHELKTPLAIMQGKLEEAIQKEEQGSECQRNYVTILEEVARLRTITDRLLMLSRGDSGQLKVDPVTLDIIDMIAMTIEDFDDGNLHLVFDEKPDEQVTVQADKMFLQEVFHNLYDNAVKFNRPDGSIETRISTTDDSVLIDIGNTGHVISAESQPLIFERFYRCLSSQDKKIDGSGLGLSLVRELLRLHGGTIELTRSSDDWTEFRVKLPLT